MKFPYSSKGLPFVDITLTSKYQSIVRAALVDSGSTINILPYEDGLDLGLSWEKQQVLLKDEGFLQGMPVYGVLLTGQISTYSPVKLAFAWTRKSREEIRLIIGQTNFFEHFEVSFQGRDKTFKIFPYDAK
jgi:hypothetical protein